MNGTQTSKLMFVMADYVDVFYGALRQDRAAQLGSIPQAPPPHIISESTSSEIPPESQPTAMGDLEATEPQITEVPTQQSPSGGVEATESQTTEGPTQQPPKPFRPEPGHRSTVLSIPSTPEDDGVSDELVDYVQKNYVRKNNFPDLQRVEIGHLFELMNWYIGYQTRPDGPFPYKIRYLSNH